MTKASIHKLQYMSMTFKLDSCHAFSERLAQLSARITRAGDLLQTQTEMIIQRQNRDLLASMNSRTKAQLHLQPRRTALVARRANRQAAQAREVLERAAGSRSFVRF